MSEIRYASPEANGRTWDLSAVLDPKSSQRIPYALVLLNTPISDQHALAFYRVWQLAEIRLVADGAANMLLDFMQSHGHKSFKMPTRICGDLDSIADHTRSFFEARYSTDLQKCIQQIEAEEDLTHIQYDLLIFGGLTGRLDQTLHTLHVLWQLAPGVPVDDIISTGDNVAEEHKDGRLRKRPHAMVLSDTCATCILSSGRHVLQHNRTILGKSCGILPLGISSAHIRTEGLEWNLGMYEALTPASQKSSLGGFFSTSNHLAPDNEAGIVLIETDAPVYWTVELKPDAEPL